MYSAIDINDNKTISFLFHTPYEYNGGNFYLFFIRNAGNYNTASTFENRVTIHYTIDDQDPSLWKSSFGNLLTTGESDNFYTLNLNSASPSICWLYKNYMALHDTSLSGGECLLAYNKTANYINNNFSNSSYKFTMEKGDGYFQDYFGDQKLFVFYDDLSFTNSPSFFSPPSYSLDMANSLTPGTYVYYVSFNEKVKFKPDENHRYRLYKLNGTPLNIYILKGKHPNINLLKNDFNITAAIIFNYNGEKYLMGTFPQKNSSEYCGFTYTSTPSDPTITPSDPTITPDDFTPPDIPIDATETEYYGWPYMDIEGTTAEHIEQMIDLQGGSLDEVQGQPYVIYINPEAE